MTPYVLNEEESNLGSQKPKSIMVSSPNGDAVRPNGDLVDTPDSIPSHSSASGKSIIGNGKNGKSGALKRVSFGSSKGSMVETLVYDHQEDQLLEPPLSEFAMPPVLDGDDSRLHPSKVRVKFIESQSVAQVRPSSTPSSPDVTLDLSSDTMTSPGSENVGRQISVDTGVDNPFRPDGELSREADTIVSLIKEGKPITHVKNEDLADGQVVANGQPKSPDSKSPVREDTVNAVDASGAKVGGANGSVAKDGSKRQKALPGVVEVKHSVIPAPIDTPQVEQVTIKKKPKGRCCVIQ